MAGLTLYEPDGVLDDGSSSLIIKSAIDCLYDELRSTDGLPSRIDLGTVASGSAPGPGATARDIEIVSSRARGRGEGKPDCSSFSCQERGRSSTGESLGVYLKVKELSLGATSSYRFKRFPTHMHSRRPLSPRRGTVSDGILSCGEEPIGVRCAL